MAFTSPLIISSSAMEKVRDQILKLIEDVRETVENDDTEHLACLNIDWVRIKK